jgi:hypothetical protein
MAKNKLGIDERKAHAEFDSAASHWLQESCELFPEYASKLGFRKYDSLLGAKTPAVHTRHIALLEQTLARIEATPEALFTGDAWLDRRGMLAHLRMELLFERDLRRWRTNPQAHTGAAIDSIFELLVRAGENPAQILPAVESRLAHLPDVLRAGASCVERPNPLVGQPHRAILQRRRGVSRWLGNRTRELFEKPAPTFLPAENRRSRL